MNKHILIEKLKTLGFKEYESKVLFALLKGIPMSASDVAREADIIRNSVYDILKSFVQKGFCNEIETDTILNYQVIDPETIMGKIKHDHTKSYNENILSIENTFSELTTIFKDNVSNAAKPTTNVQLIRGINRHRVAKYIDCFKETHKEVLGMFRVTGTYSDELNEDALSLIKKGGKIKSIYQTGLDFMVRKNGQDIQGTQQDLIKILEKFSKQGEEIRISKVKIPAITIFDKKKVFLSMSGEYKNIPRHQQADVIINNEDFAQHICDLFNLYWQNSMTIKEFKQS